MKRKKEQQKNTLKNTITILLIRLKRKLQRDLNQWGDTHKKQDQV